MLGSSQPIGNAEGFIVFFMFLCIFSHNVKVGKPLKLQTYKSTGAETHSTAANVNKCRNWCLILEYWWFALAFGEYRHLLYWTLRITNVKADWKEEGKAIIAQYKTIELSAKTAFVDPALTACQNCHLIPHTNVSL